jgi:hypothetical protein
VQGVVPEFQLEVETAEQVISLRVVGSALHSGLQNSLRFIGSAGSQQILGIDIGAKPEGAHDE